MNPDGLTDWLGKFSKIRSFKRTLSQIPPHHDQHPVFNGVDSITISKQLGHAKVSITTDIYSHIIKQADEAASKCIADMVFRPKTEQEG